MNSKFDLQQLREQFEQGKVLAYPTEAVFGLGCDPDNQQAVQALLDLKQRPLEKGLILVARSLSQLLPYINDARIPMDLRTEIVSSWPGPNTWLLPASDKAPAWITGGSDLIAVRVSAHPLVQSLCELFDKPLVSTSANVTGQAAATTLAEVEKYFAEQVVIIDGELGGQKNPSKIRHGLTGQIIRDN